MSRFSAREITLVAVFAALNVVAAMVARYGGSIVPFSLIPFMAMLAGGLLGARLGAMSMVVYILLGLAGVPVFATPPLWRSCLRASTHLRFSGGICGVRLCSGAVA
jgi:biotin transport system substrate-specific component